MEVGGFALSDLSPSDVWKRAPGAEKTACSASLRLRQTHGAHSPMMPEVFFTLLTSTKGGVDAPFFSAAPGLSLSVGLFAFSGKQESGLVYDRSHLSVKQALHSHEALLRHSRYLKLGLGRSHM